MVSPDLLQFVPMPKTVPVLPPSAELDRAETHVASPGYDAAADDWGSASDVGKGSNGGPSLWGAGSKKKLTCHLSPAHFL